MKILSGLWAVIWMQGVGMHFEEEKCIFKAIRCPSKLNFCKDQ
jgi:hypothetical protein